MEPKYTKQDIETFYIKSKNIPNFYGLEKVHLLLNNPNAKPMHKVKFNYSPLKLIFMNSILLLLIASILFFWKGNENNQSVPDVSQNLIVQKQSTPLINPTKTNDTEIKEVKITNKNVISTNKDIKNKNQLSISNETNKDEYIKREKVFKSWPSDTTLDGKKLYVRLTDFELRKLGIIKNGESFWYGNKTIGRNDVYDFHNIDLKIYVDSIFHHSFYRRYRTDSFKVDLQISEDIAEFKNVIDTLVPVIINNVQRGCVWWFTPNNDFFDALPYRYSYLRDIYNNLIQLKKTNPNRKYVNFFNWEFIDKIASINYITLKNKGFEKLFYKIDTNSISIIHPDSSVFDINNVYAYNEGNIISVYDENRYKENQIITDPTLITFFTKYQGYYSNITFSNDLKPSITKDSSLIWFDSNSKIYSFSVDLSSFNIDSVKIDSNLFPSKPDSYEKQFFVKIKNHTGKQFPLNLTPLFITDIYGRETTSFSEAINYHLKNDKDFANNIQTLIPIKIPLKEMLGFEFDRIAWYYPNDEFFDALPTEVSNNWRNEYQAIINLNTTDLKSQYGTTCTYFEACKSNLELDDFKVYPNPAKSNISIEFELTESLKGKISLINISGYEVKTIINTEFVKGNNLFNVDLSDIPPGIYIISIITDKGFKTQRIIVSQ